MAKKNTPSAPKKLSPLAVIAIVVTALLVILPIIFVSVKGPVEQVKAAAENTLLAENFTAKLKMDINGDEADGTFKLTIDPIKKVLNMYARASNHESDYELGIYEKTLVVCSSVDGSVVSYDISDRVDNFFLLLNQEGTPDWSVLLDLERSDLHEKLSEDFDFDVLIGCLEQWLGKLNKSSWAKKNAGFSKFSVSGVTTYRFDPELDVLANESAPIFESAFKETARYDALQKYLENAQFLLKDGKAAVEVDVKNGDMVGFRFGMQYFNSQASCEITFSDVGTTAVDTQTVANYIQQSKEN